MSELKTWASHRRFLWFSWCYTWMLISENTLSLAYAVFCLWPPHAWQCLNKTADHSKRVSEQRGDIWVTSATFSTEHSVTHQIFYCLSHLCACLRRREISARSHPASGHHLSLGYLPASECTRADCTSRMTAGFSLQFSVTYLDHHAYHHGRKTVYDDVSESCMSFPCLPLSFISTISLYISCKASPFLKATVL